MIQFKAILLAVFTMSMIISTSAQSAISSEGWFYKVRSWNESESRWVYSLRGAFSDKAACNSALSDATEWAEHFYPVMGSCSFYYTDEYEAIDDHQDLWGTSIIDLPGLDNETAQAVAKRIIELEEAYNIQGFKRDVQLLIDSVKPTKSSK